MPDPTLQEIVAVLEEAQRELVRDDAQAQLAACDRVGEILTRLQSPTLAPVYGVETRVDADGRELWWREGRDGSGPRVYMSQHEAERWARGCRERLYPDARVVRFRLIPEGEDE